MVSTQGTLQHVALVKSPLILEQWEGKSHSLDLLDHLAGSLPGLKPLAVGVLCVWRMYAHRLPLKPQFEQPTNDCPSIISLLVWLSRER